MSEKGQYLIVEQQTPEPEFLPELLKELHHRHKLDLYQSRQRLVGKGLSLLAQGQRQGLEAISESLCIRKIGHWIFQPSKPTFAPQRLRSLEFSGSELRCSCQKSELTFSKGATVVAVLAELSGHLLDQNVKQILSSHSYFGIDNIRQLEDDKKIMTILRGQPILDLYLTEKGLPSQGVRIFPGKFNAQGLGERATLSSAQNLKVILEIVRELAGEFQLFTDFGLAAFPGCSLQRGKTEDPEIARQNQISLVRYGWLMTDLLGAEKRGTVRNEEFDSSPAALATTAIIAQNPVLAAAGEEVTTPLRETLNEALGEEPPKVAGTKKQTEQRTALPAPPDDLMQSGVGLTSQIKYLSGIGVIFFASIIVNQIDNGDLLNHIVGRAFESGGLLFIVALVCLWGAFYFLRLKRRIENTPTSRIRSVAMGMVEVKGKAVRKYALISPMSHIPCVYYRLSRYRRDKDKNTWKKVSGKSSGRVPFYLEDETGRVEIDPARCRVSAVTKQEGYDDNSGLFSSFSQGDEKWVEEIIIDGALVYVLGFASVKRDSGPTAHEQKVEALRNIKSDPILRQRYDTNGDGQLDQQEWEAARQDVENQLIHEGLRKSRKRKKQEEQIIIGHKKGYPLVVSETHSEEQLTGRYFWYSLALFGVFAIALVWAINLLFNYLR